MFALPGLLALILLDYLRPQEFFPVLRGLRLLHVATALAALGFVVDLRLGASRLRPAPHLLLTALFAVWAIVTVAVRAPGEAVARAFGLLIPIAIYVLVAHAVQSFRMLQVLAATVLGICITLAALGVYQGLGPTACYRIALVGGEIQWLYDGRPCQERAECAGEGAEPGAAYACEKVGFGNRSAIGGRVRWVGTMEDPNELALVLGIGLPFAFAFLDRRRSAMRVLLLGLATLLIGVCSYYTRSRGGQLVFLTVPAVYFAKRLGVKRGLLLGVVLALPLLVLGGRSGASADASTEGRTEAWWVGMHLLASSPVFGVGFGQFTEYHYLTAHNTFVLAAAELGLPGLFLFTAIVYLAIKIPVEALRGALPPVARTWALALLAALAGLAVGSAFLSFLYKDVLWLYVALTGVLYQAIRLHDPEFEVRFGVRDAANVALIVVALLAAHLAYTTSKLGW